jgi:hypothetical protein
MMPSGRWTTLNLAATMTRLTSTRIPRTSRLAALWGGHPRTAAGLARDGARGGLHGHLHAVPYGANHEHGCVHDYLDCTRGVMRWY